MTRFFSQFRAICERFLQSFVQPRWMAELPDADSLLRRGDHPSDDPRANGPPIVGVL